MAETAVRMPRQITDAERELFAQIMREFGEARAPRTQFENQWEEIAALIDPMNVGTFTYGNMTQPGEKKTDYQIDASGMLANARFAAICDSLLTPRNMKYEIIKANNKYLMKDRSVRLWFENVTDILFDYRYSAAANFSSNNNMVYHALGAYGTGHMFIDALDPKQGFGRGLRYKALGVGTVYIRESHQGIVMGFFRVFKMTAAQAYEKWGAEKFPEQLRPALEAQSQNLYVFIQRVCPNTGYDKERLDYKGMPYISTYVSVEGQCVMDEGGYNSMPLVSTRYLQGAEEVYGRSPAMLVLPSLKTLNAEKKVFLKQGHRAGDPVLLTADDGLASFNLRPGAMNSGYVTSEGKPLVHVLPTGEIQITKEMMADEKMLINDAFLVTLFQILTETPQMTATEVIERTNEKGILLAPTVGRQQSEYRGPSIARELDVLAEQRLLPPMPPALKEAQGEYQITFSSPMSRAMRAQEAAGWYRTVEHVSNVVNITQDPSYFDPLDFDAAIPEIADINGVKPSWMAPQEKIDAKRQARAKQAQQQMQIQAAPAAAAMMKAKAQAAQTQAASAEPLPPQ